MMWFMWKSEEVKKKEWRYLSYTMTRKRFVNIGFMAKLFSGTYYFKGNNFKMKVLYWYFIFSSKLAKLASWRSCFSHFKGLVNITWKGLKECFFSFKVPPTELKCYITKQVQLAALMSLYTWAGVYLKWSFMQSLYYREL